MTARDPHGDAPAWRRGLVRAKDAVKRRRGTGRPVGQVAEGYLVVPVLGQSNAHGAGLGLDPTGLDAPHPRVHQWATSGRSRGTIVAGADPLFHEVPAPGVGFGPAFARRLADHTGRAVLLVPSARGDTSFTPKNGYTWDPADTRTRVNLHRRALIETARALAAAPGSHVAAVLWHQGESDVPLTPPARYAELLDSMIDDLRLHLGDVPVVLGQMVPEEIETGHPGYRGIDAVHAETPRRRARTVYVPGPRGAFNAPDETIHYDARGARALGDSMFAALVEHGLIGPPPA